MQMRPEIQIKSVLKAMSDVVLPALDPSNQLAQEQARLCMGLLSLLSTQMPLQYRFDCDELRRLRAMGERLLPLADPRVVEASTLQTLAQAIRTAADVLDRAKAEPAELVESVRSLRAITGALVQQACASGTGADTKALERVVLDSSAEQLLRDRAWLLPQGWEPDPASFPPIDTLIASI
jgi:conjugal transfer/entry exclusion protein